MKRSAVVHVHLDSRYKKENVPDNGVVAYIIVTEPAVEPFATAVGLQFASSPVVLASQNVPVGILKIEKMKMNVSV